MSEKSQISKESRLSDWIQILPFTSLIAIGIIIFFVYAFFSGMLYNFYASALFLFYALAKRMWVAVIMLGVFQTLMLVPLRIVRVIRSDNIKEFQYKVKKIGGKSDQLEAIQSDFKGGNRAFIFYLVDFVIQLATFLTMGRLFLTDFYSTRLDPRVLYDFVPYPSYPIRDTMFKIPYLDITRTVDLGLRAVLIFWAIILLVQLVIWLAKRIYASYRNLPRKSLGQTANKYTFGYIVILLILSALILRNFPVGFAIAIFSGDVSIPNRTLNTITALATFLTLLWFGVQRIKVKGEKAKEKQVPPEIIDATQKEMFKDTVFTAALVGLGAFYVTNQIPSAFELSIFTLEVIAMFSPLTLDKFILKTKQQLSPAS